MVQGIGRSYAMRSRGLWIKANLVILLEATAVHSGSNLSAPSDKEKFFLPNNSHPNPWPSSKKLSGLARTCIDTSAYNPLSESAYAWGSGQTFGHSRVVGRVQDSGFWDCPELGIFAPHFICTIRWRKNLEREEQPEEERPRGYCVGRKAGGKGELLCMCPSCEYTVYAYQTKEINFRGGQVKFK